MIWWICLSVFLLQLFLAIILKTAVFFKRDTSLVDQSRPNTISIVIPFHAEEKRIMALINSLNNSETNDNFELLFVNDHSTDQTVALITAELKYPFKILKNPYTKGKKYAIKWGIENASHESILTWDADIYFTPDYLSTLKNLQLHDMDILPVQMETYSLIGKLGCIEFTYLESFGQGAAALGKPIIANGANLLFNKTLFLKMDQQRNDYGIPSGDDLFLLAAFQNNKAIIQHHTNPQLAVTTSAPSNFKALIQQRKRWISKIRSLISASSLLGLFVLISVQITFVIALIYSFINPLFLVLIGIKILAEIIVTTQFLKRDWRHLLILMIHQVWYPFYCIALVIPVQKEQRWE